MAIDLLNIQPHVVSRDLKGYSVLFYGEPKSGKTTIASKFPKSLLLAFEKGYAALPGVKAQPINKWSEFRTVLRQLAKPELKEMYTTIIVDTADIAYDLCEKYICSNAPRPGSRDEIGVDSIGDIPFGAGYSMLAKEFDECLRSIVQMNYGLVLISHSTDKTFKDEKGSEYNQIVPTLGASPRKICSRMCDIIGYSRGFTMDDGSVVTKLFMRGTPRYVAGSRFPYTPDVIDFTYQALVDAIGDSIDKQAAESGQDLFTDNSESLHAIVVEELDFDTLMDKFNATVQSIKKFEGTDDEKKQNDAYWNPRIVEVIERFLGKGAKIMNCARTQTEALDLIVKDLQDLLSTK